MPRKLRPMDPAAERFAFTIAEFCAAHRISRAQYYEMKRLNEGPDEMHAKNKILISMEAAARWRQEREGAAAAALKQRPSPRRRQHR